MKRIVLASSSPRRRDICIKYGLNPIIDSPDLEELQRDYEGPEEITMALSFEKANSIASKYKSGEIILASDTVVVFDGEILGKPRNREEAFKMLSRLNGKTHRVITGLALIETASNKKIIDYVESKVRFKSMTDKKIKSYIDTGEYKDKAGAYGIQGYGQLLVESIDGSYLNIVGLPIERVDELLEEHFNISLI